MTIHTKLNNTWLNDGKPFVKVNGVWKEVETGYSKRNGSWEVIYENKPPVYMVTHPNGGITYKAEDRAKDNTFYYLEEADAWLYVVGENDLQTIIDQFKELGGNTPNVSLTDNKNITKSIPLRNIVTTKVTTLANAFRETPIFNQDISTWDTSNVLLMHQMFAYATIFNQDLSNWNTSKVTSTHNMFTYTTAFNSDISKWDTSKVTSMNWMFHHASNFNQDLSQWCVTNITREPTAFSTNTPNWTLPKPVWGTCP